jgi:hypothetical protein
MTISRALLLRKLWWVAAAILPVAVVVCFQLPPWEWRSARAGEQLPAEIAAWPYREPVKGVWFGPRVWGGWMMTLRLKDGVVVEKTIIIQLGTSRRRHRMTIFTGDANKQSRPVPPEALDQETSRSKSNLSYASCRDSYS